MGGLEMSAAIAMVAIPVVLTLFLLTSATVNRLQPNRLAGYTGLMFGIAWVAAVVTLGYVVMGGPVRLDLLSWGNQPLFGFVADRLSGVIVLLVVTISGIVHLFSLRSMQEERAFSRYLTLLTLVTTAVVLVVLANNLLMLAVFWIAKGLTLTFLLAHYQERKASWQAAFTKLRIDLIGATALIVALILTWDIFGTFDIAAINARAGGAAGIGLTILTLALLVAAMAKSAQFPLHRWVPLSVEAPTPVSALMHAGLINAGGYLIIRLSFLFEATPITMGAAIIVGGFTALYGTTLMLTRNDVKGMLVYSTIGQMGFMMLECGLGAFGLAALHMVAHGLYKATMFLNAGDVVQRNTTQKYLPHAKTSGKFELVRFTLLSSVAAGLLAIVPLWLGFAIGPGTILLAFGWITLIHALPKLNMLSTPQLLSGVVGFTLLYIVITHGVELFFASVVSPSPILAPVIVLAIAGSLAIVGLISVLGQNLGWPNFVKRLGQRLYVRLIFVGYDR